MKDDTNNVRKNVNSESEQENLEFDQLFDMLGSYQSQYDLPMNFAESVADRLTEIQQISARENKMKIIGITFLLLGSLIALLMTGVELKFRSILPYAILFGGLIVVFHYLERKFLIKPLSRI